VLIDWGHGYCKGKKTGSFVCDFIRKKASSLQNGTWVIKKVLWLYIESNIETGEIIMEQRSDKW